MITIIIQIERSKSTGLMTIGKVTNIKDSNRSEKSVEEVMESALAKALTSIQTTAKNGMLVEGGKAAAATALNNLASAGIDVKGTPFGDALGNMT